MNRRIKIFKKPQVTIEECTVKCEKDMFLLSQISRIWIGKLPIPKISNIASLAILILALTGIYYINILAVISVLFAYMLFCIYKVYSQSKYIGLNFELNSGSLYCFHSDKLDIIQQVYDLSDKIIKEKNFECSYFINFDGNGEIINLQKVKNKDVLTEDIHDLTGEVSPLKQELHKLMLHYKNHHEDNAHIIALLKEIAQGMESNNTQLKELYVKFIQSDLIGDCDELGLHLLINEVKTSVF